MKKNQTPFEIFTTLTRENTGISFMDSGGANGRHWQHPAISEELPYRNEVWDENEVSSAMSTAHFLASVFDDVNNDENRKLNNAFMFFANRKENKDEAWFSLVHEYGEKMGWTSAARNNTCNDENDFSQDFVFEMFYANEAACEIDDYLYGDVIVCIHTHNGADVRGGYSSPIFIQTSDLAENYFFDWVVGFAIDDPEEIMFAEREREEMGTGYHSCPVYHLNEMLEEKKYTVELNDDKSFFIVWDEKKEKSVNMYPEHYGLMNSGY